MNRESKRCQRGMTRATWGCRHRTATTTRRMPAVVDRATWQAERDALMVREKALHPRRRRDRGGSSATPDGGGGSRDHADWRSRACNAARRVRRPPPAGRLLPHVARRPARRGQCEGCTFFNGQVRELSYLHSRDVTYATFCEGPYEESVRYRDFMGWEVPWYSAQDPPTTAGRALFAMLACYLRDGDRVFETYWTTRPRFRGDGPQLRAVGHDRVRPAGDLGGLARRLAATLADTK